jgi:predicted  nucleic acid-binding Zn-ribbon protein
VKVSGSLSRGGGDDEGGQGEHHVNSMHPDLERVIALQRLDTSAHDGSRRLAEEPDRERALEARLDAARQRLATARENLAGNQKARREIEKDVAVHQGRLSKFREQAMAVKTNQEYHAIQKEIGFAQGEIKALEDRILEGMLEADELAAGVKRAEAELTSEQKTADAEHRAIATEHTELESALQRIGIERAELVGVLDPSVLAVFELVSRRRHGVAVAEARDGVCTICHVRLRPQVFNNVRRNDQIIQCDSCQRILYFAPAPAQPAADAVTQPAP